MPHNLEQEPVAFRLKFADIANYIDSVSGTEKATDLDKTAQVINHYYQEITFADILTDNAYGIQPTNLHHSNLGEKLVDAHTRFRRGQVTPIEKPAFVSLLGNTDVFKPLIEKTVTAFQQCPTKKAGSLLYLFYHIENPFLGPTLEAETITEESHKLYKKADKPELNQETVDKVGITLNEFVLAATNWKNAWAYFGPDRAEAVLKLALNPKYGAIFFKI